MSARRYRFPVRQPRLRRHAWHHPVIAIAAGFGWGLWLMLAMAWFVGVGLFLVGKGLVVGTRMLVVAVIAKWADWR